MMRVEMMRVKRSVLLKRENNIFHGHILFYTQGSSLLTRSECLLLSLIIIIIIIIWYCSYLVLFLSMVSGRGLSPCHRCHPIFKSVPREREMEKVLKIGWQRWHGDNPTPWKVLLNMKTKKQNIMKANEQSYYWTKS